MHARSARLAFALTIIAPVLTGAVLSAQNVEYAPGTMRYRISTTTKGSQTSGANSASFDIVVLEDLTVKLAKPSRDTVTATATLDSVSVKSSGGTPDVSKLKGITFVSRISPTGKFYSAALPQGMDAIGGQIVDGVSHFLPSWRSNLANGTTWTDTVSGKVNQNGMDVDRTSISSYVVKGDSTIRGMKAMRIHRTTAVKATGAGTMQGAAVSMESTGTSVGSFFVTATGKFLGSDSVDDLGVKIQVLGQNVEIGLKQNGVTHITTLM